MAEPGSADATEAGLLTRKPIEEAIRESEGSGYRRALGAFDLTSLGVAAIIGAGIFVTLGSVAHDAGPAVIFSYIITGIACIFAALAYAELAAMIPGSGSAYTFVFASMGRMPAFLCAWFLILEYVVANMFVAVGWSQYFAAALDRMGLVLPDSLRRTFLDGPGGGIDLPAMLIVAVVTALVIAGIKESVRVGNVLVAFKVLVVLFVIIAGLAFVRPGNYTEFNPGGFGAVAAASSTVFFAFIGFDAVSATAEEARNPRRDLPISIVGSLVISMVLYVLMALVLTGMVHYSGIGGDAPVAAAFYERGFPLAGALVTAGAIVATFTVLLAFSIGLPRIFQSMARDRLLPESWSALHPRYKTPARIALVAGCVTIVGAGLVPGDFAVDLTNLGTLAVYAMACVGVLLLRRIAPEARRPFRAHWIFSAAGALMCVGLMMLVDRFSQVVFIAWIGAGLALAGFYSAWRRSSSQRVGP